MARSRRKFTNEFKREAVRLAELPDDNVSQVARDLVLNPSVLRRWIREMQVGICEPTPAKPLKSAPHHEAGGAWRAASLGSRPSSTPRASRRA